MPGGASSPAVTGVGRVGVPAAFRACSLGRPPAEDREDRLSFTGALPTPWPSPSLAMLGSEIMS